ncbi:MAG: hypothetical protein R3E96_14210 [Planctomycetota bacterium]
MYLNGALTGYFPWKEEISGWWKVSLGLASKNMNKSLYGDDSTGFVPT